VCACVPADMHERQAILSRARKDVLPCRPRPEGKAMQERMKSVEARLCVRAAYPPAFSTRVRGIVAMLR